LRSCHVVGQRSTGWLRPGRDGHPPRLMKVNIRQVSGWNRFAQARPRRVSPPDRASACASSGWRTGSCKHVSPACRSTREA
jgi:hypothetical protein